MRRAMLLLVGIGGCGLLLLSLGLNAAAIYQPSVSKPVLLPVSVEDTPLQVLELVCYDGPFWEDETDREVSNVASVVIKNTGGYYVAAGAVILETGLQRYIFEFTWLPPGAQVLVLEQAAQPYFKLDKLRCYGWTSECYPERTGAVTAQPVDDISLAVFNRSNHTVEAVTLCYKHYDAQRDMYIGGITYQAEAGPVQPGQTLTLSPWHYVCGYSRVLCVLES